MQDLIRGRVIKMPFNDVSTDVIAPNRYRATSGEDRELTALRPWVMGALRPGLNDIVKPGDIFVVGRNFGLGSHRETAVRIFKIWGVQAIVAELGAAGPGDMGKVMGVVKTRLAGKADMGQVSAAVKAALAG